LGASLWPCLIYTSINNKFYFRGRRGKANDLFWANRGKRNNFPKPNGFNFLMGKRSGSGIKKNAFKPNGFNFLLTKTGAGKRSSGMPRPNSFLFPVKREGFNFRNIFPAAFEQVKFDYNEFTAVTKVGISGP